MKFNSIESIKLHGYHQWIQKGFTESLTISRETEGVFVNSSQTYPYVWVSYTLTPFPSCCGVAISHNAYITHNHKGYGLGNYFLKERIQLCKDAGYSCIIATVTSQNEIEKHLLLKNGWKMIHSFVNKRTNNPVEFWIKDL